MWVALLLVLQFPQSVLHQEDIDLIPSEARVPYPFGYQRDRLRLSIGRAAFSKVPSALEAPTPDGPTHISHMIHVRLNTTTHP